MRLDISELLREVGKHMPYDIEEPPLVDEDVECTAPIVGQIAFTNAGATLLIRGRAETRLAMACGRCNAYFDEPIKLAIDEQFPLHHVPAAHRSLPTVAVVEEDESPIAGKLFDGPIFDLSELLRQYILLEQPIKPLPPDAPDGTCSHCHLAPEEAIRRIEATHEKPKTPDTATAPINPAFAKLGELLDREASQ